MTYNFGSSYVNVYNTVMANTYASNPLAMPGTTTATENVAWSGYASITWPDNLMVGGSLATTVTVTYAIDDVAYAGAMAFSQINGNSASATAISDDLTYAFASESNANQTNDIYGDFEQPNYTPYTYTITYTKSQLTPLAGSPGVYITPDISFFNTSLYSSGTYSMFQQQGLPSNGAGATVNVFFDTSGNGFGANSITFGS